jgi:predicted nucleic acid-binding Zn ribbon protein
LAQKASGSAPAHKHCPVCGISIAPTKSYCSNECEGMDEGAQKRMKNYRRLTLILMVGAMVVLVALTLFLRARG